MKYKNGDKVKFARLGGLMTRGVVTDVNENVIRVDAADGRVWMVDASKLAYNTPYVYVLRYAPSASAAGVERVLATTCRNELPGLLEALHPGVDKAKELRRIEDLLIVADEKLAEDGGRNEVGELTGITLWVLPDRGYQS